MSPFPTTHRRGSRRPAPASSTGTRPARNGSHIAPSARCPAATQWRLVGRAQRPPQLADRVEGDHPGDLVAVAAIEAAEHHRHELEGAVEHADRTGRRPPGRGAGTGCCNRPSRLVAVRVSSSSAVSQASTRGHDDQQRRRAAGCADGETDPDQACRRGPVVPTPPRRAARPPDRDRSTARRRSPADRSAGRRRRRR